MRERYEIHTEDPVCAACHMYIDPLGFGLENFDGIGRFRLLDNNKDVDAVGRVVRLDGSDDKHFECSVELASWMSTSDELRSCVSGLWVEYALGRPIGKADGCSHRSIMEQFESSDYNIRELILAVVGSDSFTHANVGEGK